MSLVLRAKQLVLPIRRSRVVRRAYDRLERNTYGRGRNCGAIARSIEQVLSYGVFAGGDRERSVHRLIELFFQLCEMRDIDVFIEAGAKEAAASQRAAALGCQAVAFEANPYTHGRFAAALAETRVDYRHEALSDRPGAVSFMVRLSEAGTPLADGQGSLLVRPDHDPGYEEATIQATTLDNHLASMDVPDARIAIWVDVEGALSQMLGGAAATLRRTDVLMVEVETVRLWNGQRWLANDVVLALAEAGLAPVARDIQSRHQYNVVFVRASLKDTVEVSAAIRDFKRSDFHA